MSAIRVDALAVSGPQSNPYLDPVGLISRIPKANRFAAPIKIISQRRVLEAAHPDSKGSPKIHPGSQENGLRPPESSLPHQLGAMSRGGSLLKDAPK